MPIAFEIKTVDVVASAVLHKMQNEFVLNIEHNK